MFYIIYIFTDAENKQITGNLTEAVRVILI